MLQFVGHKRNNVHELLCEFGLKKKLNAELCAANRECEDLTGPSFLQQDSFVCTIMKEEVGLRGEQE